MIGFHLDFEHAIQHEYSQCYAASNHQYIYPQRMNNIIDKLSKFITKESPNKVLVFHCGYVNRQDSARSDVLEKTENDSYSLILIAKHIQQEFLKFNPNHKTIILFHVYKLRQVEFSRKILQSFKQNIHTKGMGLVFEQTSTMPMQDFIQFQQQLKCQICIDTAHLWANGVTIDQFLQLNLKNIGLIHLNGNCLNMNTHHDKHCDILSPSDQVWQRDTLHEFLKKYKNIVMICERDNDYYLYDIYGLDFFGEIKIETKKEIINKEKDVNERLRNCVNKRFCFEGWTNTLTPVSDEQYRKNEANFVQLKEDEKDYNVYEIAYLLYQDYETNLYISLNKNDTNLPSVTSFLHRKIETWPCIDSDLAAIVHDESSSYNSYRE